MSQATKTYLEPRALRRGNEIVHFIQKNRSADDLRKNFYWLSTYYDRIPARKAEYDGVGKEYNASMSIRISKETYEALLKQAKDNHKRMKSVGDYEASIEMEETDAS